MATTINNKDDQHIDAMAFPQPNTSPSSLTTSTTTTQINEPKTTNSHKLCYFMNNSTTTLKQTLSNQPSSSQSLPLLHNHGALDKKQQSTTSVIEPVIKNKNANKKRRNDINEDYKPPKKRRNVQKKVVVSSIVEQDGPNIISTMIDHVKNTFKGYNNSGVISNAEIIMERKLNPTDIAEDQGRLAIPKGQILTEFLTDEEVQALSRKVNAISMATMDVKVIIGSNNYDMSLSRWNYKAGGGFKYALKNKEGQWTKIKANHNLDVNDMILVTTFRHNNVLHFAIHKKRSIMLFGKKIEQYRM